MNEETQAADLARPLMARFLGYLVWGFIFLMGIGIGCAVIDRHFLAKAAERGKAEDDLVTLKYALKSYRAEFKRLPTQAEGLKALTCRPADVPYSPAWEPEVSAVPADPWGNPYRYVRDDSLPEGFGIYSTGPNGMSRSQGNDSDDFNSWTEK